jgi:RsiW-degrading membrane proteinase PrsW (M82 family)
MKVNREHIKATLVTLCVAGVIVNFIHNYREMRESHGFPIATIYGMMIVFILLIPLMWVKRLRANKPLNAVVFLSLFGFIVIGSCQVNGNKPVSYICGLLWVGAVCSYIGEILEWTRKRKTRISSVPGMEQE